MKPDAVGADVAESEFERLCEAANVEHDASEMHPAEAETFAELRRKVTKAIRRGSLTVGVDGLATYQAASNARGFAFKRLDASVLIASSGKHQPDDMTKTIHIIAGMTERPASEISRLSIADVKVCGVLAALFLAAE